MKTYEEMRQHITLKAWRKRGVSRRELRDSIQVIQRKSLMLVLQDMVADASVTGVMMYRGGRPGMLFFSDPAHATEAQAASESRQAHAYKAPKPIKRAPKPVPLVLKKRTHGAPKAPAGPVDYSRAKYTQATPVQPFVVLPPDYVSGLDTERCSGWARLVAP
jgi:hypothetical protein